MSVECPADSSVQSSYIQMLEERLRDLEQRMLAVERTGERAAEVIGSEDKTEHEGAERGQSDRGRNESSDEDTTGKSNGEDPLPESSKDGQSTTSPSEHPQSALRFLPYAHHVLPADNRPVIEVRLEQLASEDLVETHEKFVASLADVTPEKALKWSGLLEQTFRNWNPTQQNFVSAPSA
ncbi:hypothetical protein BDW59DRAFT_162514 [Aspergillus cavernicola]|uniref:Uncharacterized protein n=1 Tax=Aspergillus cavernicola TaxID=176166 RepID=A0ABR4I9I2_9EURO